MDRESFELNDLDQLAQQLGELRVVPRGVDRDQLLYQAGRLSVERTPRHLIELRAWRVAALAAALAAVLIGAGWRSTSVQLAHVLGEAGQQSDGAAHIAVEPPHPSSIASAAADTGSSLSDRPLPADGASPQRRAHATNGQNVESAETSYVVSHFWPVLSWWAVLDLPSRDARLLHQRVERLSASLDRHSSMQVSAWPPTSRPARTAGAGRAGSIPSVAAARAWLSETPPGDSPL